MKEVIVFIHIPKTAGSTFKYILKQLYANDEWLYLKNWRWTDWRQPFDEIRKAFSLSQPEVIYGHLHFGGIQEIIGKPVKYFTIMREPVNRVISGYFHLLRDTRFQELHDISKMSMKSLMESGLYSDLDNGQVRRLSGVANTVPYGAIGPEHLQQALDNIEKHFLFVGLTERFDESIVLMSRALGWPMPYYWKQNRGKNKKPEILNEADIAAVKAYNQYDLLLYEKMKQRFEELLTAQPVDVEAFRRQNRHYNLRILPMKVYRKLNLEFKRKILRKRK